MSARNPSSGTPVAVELAGQDVRINWAGEVLADGLRVVFPEPWQRTSTEHLMDELEQRWRCDEVEAIVRQVLGESPVWSLRVQVVNRGAEPASVPGCQLEMDAAWPPRIWLAGAEGQIGFTPPSPGGLPTMTQLRGRSRLSDDVCWLSDTTIRLAAGSELAGQYQVAWRLDLLADERMQAAALPTWWPTSVTLVEGDVLQFDLPDAAIEAAGMDVIDESEGTSLSGKPGLHLAQVHAGRGTTDVELAIAPAADLASERVSWLLDHQDPRTATPGQAFLVGRLVGQRSAAQEWLRSSVEEQLRGELLAPATVLAMAELAMVRPGTVDVIEDALARMATEPGAELARVRCVLAAHLAGARVMVPGGVRQSLGRVDASLLDLEGRIVRRQQIPREDDWQVFSLLGAGLPGRTVGARQRALLVALCAMLPEQVQLDERWPRSLAGVREQSVRRLLAECPDDEVLALLSL